MYQDEESIKARLRELTAESRRLRQDLNAMLRSGGAKDLTRGLTLVSGRIKTEPPAVASDRRRPGRHKR
jgi:hypothetical protein